MLWRWLIQAASTNLQLPNNPINSLHLGHLSTPRKIQNGCDISTESDHQPHSGIHHNDSTHTHFNNNNPNKHGTVESQFHQR